VVHTDAMDLRLLPDSLSVCRLPSSSPWPAPAGRGFYSATRVEDELSIVCASHEVPDSAEARVEEGWRVLEVAGPLDFSMIGVLASLSAVLAEAEVSIFVISTHDTDYVLVRDEKLERAMDALREAGHTVRDE